MNDELRFDGRVAVVTGGGRGLGRAHALALGRRGAQVVVNDLGTDVSGAGSTPQRAEDTAAEIVAGGGTAIAHHGDVSSEADVRELVRRTIATFGRLDVLVNNAGIQGYVPLHDMNVEAFERFHQVHVLGSFLTTRAAWPHMVEQGYGRVVMTSSVGMFGPERAAHYAAAKAALFGLMRAASVEGEQHGIAVNGIMPAAVTPAVDELGAQDTEMSDGSFDPSPDLVSPVVAWLAHEQCPTSGQLFHAGLGWVGRIITGQGPGYRDPDLSVESVRDHWDEICTATPLTEIPSTHDGLEALLKSATAQER